MISEENLYGFSCRWSFVNFDIKHGMDQDISRDWITALITIRIWANSSRREAASRGKKKKLKIREVQREIAEISD